MVLFSLFVRRPTARARRRRRHHRSTARPRRRRAAGNGRAWSAAAGTSSGFSGRTRRGVTSTSSSVRSFRSALLLNRLPMIGIWLRIGIAATSFCDSLSIRPAMAKDCPSRSSTSVSARRVVSAGMRKPCSRMPLLKSSELTSGRTCRRIRSPAIVGLNVQPHAELLELDRDGVAVAALDDRHRELAAGEEAGLLAVVGDQVRLGQALEVAGLLQRLQQRRRRCDFVLNRNRFRKSLKTSSSSSKVGRRELLRRAAADPVLESGGAGEERHAHLHQRPAVDLGEPHLQHHLLGVGSRPAPSAC